MNKGIHTDPKSMAAFGPGDTRRYMASLLRACAKITSHFRIPPSGHLCLPLNRKILEIVLLFLWICSIGAAKSDLNLGTNSAKLFLRKP